MPSHRHAAAVRVISIATVLGVSLSACGLPLPVQVASLVANGISYFETEKTVSDHGVSVVVGKDCRMLRALAGGDYCTTFEPTMAIAVQAEGDVSEAPDSVKGEPEFEIEAEPKPKARASGSKSGLATAPSPSRPSIVAVEVAPLAAEKDAAASPAFHHPQSVAMAADALTDDPELPDRLPPVQGEGSGKAMANASSMELTDDPELPDRLVAADSVVPSAPPIRLEPFSLARVAHSS